MGLFDKNKNKKECDKFTVEILNIANEVIEKNNINVKNITDLEMHIASFYLLGFATALKMEKYKKITPAQMHGIMTSIISTIFLSSITYSSDLIADGIKSMQKKESNDKRMIIHKGMDAYILWKDNGGYGRNEI